MENKLVQHIGKISPSEEDMKQALVLLTQAKGKNFLEALYNEARTQGVLEQVCHNYHVLVGQGFSDVLLDEFFTQTKKTMEARRKRVEYLNQELVTFAKQANRRKIQYMIIKGACLAGLYPPGSTRAMNDIDLLISEDAVWESLKLFQEIGYNPKRIRVETYPFSRSVSDKATKKKSQEILGIAEMYKDDPNDLPFDLHLGAFPGCGDSVMESNIWERTRCVEICDQSLLSPSFEDCLLIICVHISRHGYAKLRDINDIFMCLSAAGVNFDWDYLFSFAERNSLKTILSVLLHRLHEDTDLAIPTTYLPKKPNTKSTAFKLLFDTGKQNRSFHGGRRLIVSRLLQVSFLYSYYKNRSNIGVALKEVFSASIFLFRSGRPYELWRERRIMSVIDSRRFVMIPLNGRLQQGDDGVKHINTKQVRDLASNSGVQVLLFGNNTIVWNVGNIDEFIITPYMIYTQSAYDGNIDQEYLTKMRDNASQLYSRLISTNAIY